MGCNAVDCIYVAHDSGQMGSCEHNNKHLAWKKAGNLTSCMTLSFSKRTLQCRVNCKGLCTNKQKWQDDYKRCIIRKRVEETPSLPPGGRTEENHQIFCQHRWFPTTIKTASETQHFWVNLLSLLILSEGQNHIKHFHSFDQLSATDPMHLPAKKEKRESIDDLHQWSFNTMGSSYDYESEGL